MSEKPRILLVTRNMPPLVGGMERLVHHVYHELKPSFDIKVVGPQGCDRFLDPGDCAAQIPVAPRMAFLRACQWAAFKAAHSCKPHIILAGSGVTAPAVWLAARTTGARSICMAHGMDIAVANKAYRMGFLPAIRRCDVLVANSRYTSDLAVRSGVLPARIRMLHPGIDPPFGFSADEIRAFRVRIGAGDRPILLSVGRLTERKGIVEFFAACMPEIVLQVPNVLLVVIGGDAKDALIEVQPVSARLQQQAREMQLEKHLCLLGWVTDRRELGLAYAASNLHSFPVRSLPGDIEGFGMVAIEAASYGLPTVVFDVGGVGDAVKGGESGYLVSAGNYRAFAQTIVAHLRRHGDNPRLDAESCRQFARGFLWNLYGQKLRKICSDLLGDNAVP